MGALKLTYHERENAISENWKIFVQGIEKNASSQFFCKDYFTFGMRMPGRCYVSSDRYRFGYQGSERDEASGMDRFQLRSYDSRLGRWFAPDPMNQFHSPYLAMANNPVNFIDPTGGYASLMDKYYQHEFETGNVERVESDRVGFSMKNGQVSDRESYINRFFGYDEKTGNYFQNWEITKTVGDYSTSYIETSYYSAEGMAEYIKDGGGLPQSSEFRYKKADLSADNYLYQMAASFSYLKNIKKRTKAEDFFDFTNAQKNFNQNSVFGMNAFWSNKFKEDRLNAAIFTSGIKADIYYTDLVFLAEGSTNLSKRTFAICEQNLDKSKFPDNNPLKKGEKLNHPYAIKINASYGENSGHSGGIVRFSDWNEFETFVNIIINGPAEGYWKK